jgi:hypothetical protein
LFVGDSDVWLGGGGNEYGEAFTHSSFKVSNSAQDSKLLLRRIQSYYCAGFKANTAQDSKPLDPSRVASLRFR